METSRDEFLSDMERDVIGEVMNISLGSSATSLSSLLNQRVEITVPQVSVINALEFCFDNLQPAVGVEIKYLAGIEGDNVMILKKADIKIILETLMGTTIEDDDFEFDEIAMSAVCEVMNQMMGSAATALADFLGKRVDISTPVTYEIKNPDDFKGRYFSDNDTIVAVKFSLHVGQLINSEFINVISVPLAKEMVSLFLSGTGLSDSNDTETASLMEESIELDSIAEEKTAEEKTAEEKTASVSNDQISKREEITYEDVKPKRELPRESKANRERYAEEADGYDDYDDYYDEDEEEMYVPRKKKRRNYQRTPKPQVNVSSVEYESFDDDDEILSEEQLTNLGLIMSVPLQISVEIGRTKRKIKDILEFQQGTIVELDKQAGEQVDIIVNGQVIAKGDVVVINDNFGVRVTEIVKQDEIVKLTM